jgi:RNA polymerase sigma-70 factor (ECF subfamily)
MSAIPVLWCVGPSPDDSVGWRVERTPLSTHYIDAEARDRDALARLATGDAEALRDLFGWYYAPLLSFVARYVHDDDVARDILQDVFAAIWVRRTTVAPRGPVAGYLYGAARNEALRWRAHRGVVTRWEHAERDGNDIDAGAVPSAQQQLELDEMSAAIDRAVAALPPRIREVFLLSRNDQLGHKAIAEALGISPQTVANQISRALQLLEQALHDWR